MAIELFAPSEKRYCIADQATWGTAVLDNAATWYKLISGHATIDPDIKVRQFPQVHGTRRNYTEQQLHDQKGSMPKITLSGPVYMDYLDLLMGSFFQTVTYSGAGPYKSVFTIASGEPADFSANAGIMLSVREDLPNVGGSDRSRKMIDCVASRLRLYVDRGGVLMYDVDLVGRGAMTATGSDSTATATVETDILNFESIRQLYYTTGSKTYYPVGTCEVVFTQDVIPIGNSSGNPANFSLLNRKGTFSFTVAETDDENIAFTQYTSAAAATLGSWNLSWGSVALTSDNDLDITFTGKVEKADVVAADVIGVNISGTMLTSATSSSEVTVTMLNDVNRTW